MWGELYSNVSKWGQTFGMASRSLREFRLLILWGGLGDLSPTRRLLGEIRLINPWRSQALDEKNRSGVEASLPGDEMWTYVKFLPIYIWNEEKYKSTKYNYNHTCNNTNGDVLVQKTNCNSGKI